MLQIISKLVVPKLLPWNKKMQIIFNNNISTKSEENKSRLDFH